jgi:hypothetical protein|tara:strand:+ start:2227 stop:3231 length:1005 start_codon:yes stop_codon:yes gene_type:complete
MAEKNILESIIDYIKPKAHDAIDTVTKQWDESKNSPMGQLSPELQETIQGLVMGGGGVGGMLTKTRKGLKSIPGAQWEKIFGSKTVDKSTEGVKQLAFAMKGKIKDGKLIPNQPFKQGMIGKPSTQPKMGPLETYSSKISEAIDKTNKKLYGSKTPTTKFDWERKLEKAISKTENTPSTVSFDVGGWKNVAPAQAKIIQSKDKGKWGLAGLLGLLGLTQDDQGSYVGEDSSQEMPPSKLNQILQDVTFLDIINKLIPNPDMSNAGDMPIGQTDMPNDELMNVLRKQLKETDQNYYEGETPIGLEELAKIIQGEEQEEIINYPQNLSNRARSWAK